MAERTIGNYVLGPLLGRGGMSEVHAGEHRFLGDRVAIKLLRSHLAGDAAATEAFVAEATRTRAIDHPGVVRVLDFGSDGDAFYLVMERLDGESLAVRLARCGRLDEAEVRRLGAALADGLAAAHDRGIVHRDLKPGNIMLVGEQPKIIDFGIAREVARSAVTGSRVGTVAYMAPEQLTGGLVAPCVDIWALGVVLYEALAGRLPFDGFDDGRSPQLFETAPRLASLAAVSPALDALIASCLEREPGRRPASMHALAAALRNPTSTGERLTEDVAPPWAPFAAGTQPADPQHAAPPRRRSRTIAIAVGAVAGVIAGSLWLVHGSSGGAPPESAAAANGAAPTSAGRARADEPGDAVPAIREPSADDRQLAAVSREPTDRQPSTAGREPAADSRQPSTANRAPVADDRQPSAASREPAAADRQPSTAGREPAADSRQPSTANRAPVADDRQPSAASREPAAADRQPSTAGREPAADSRQPSTANRAPVADDRQPSTASRTADAAAAAAAGGAAASTASAAARTPASFTVEVRSAPPGARVTVAGKRVGVTPTTIALDAPASITVSRAGYRSQRVRAERPGPIDVRLVPARPAPASRRPAAGETLD